MEENTKKKRNMENMVFLRLTADQHDKLAKQSKDLGMPMSAIVRSLVITHLRKPERHQNGVSSLSV